MSSTLRRTLTDLASAFALNVLEAIRESSLEEILSEASQRGGRRVVGRPKATTSSGPASNGLGRAPRKRGGRLGRRSADDISDLVERIVALLGEHETGLRAEQIREALSLEAKELPRPLAEAVRSRRIGKSGQKRATTYFVKASRAGARGAKAAPSAKAPKAGRKGAAKKIATAKKSGRKAAAEAKVTRRGRGRRAGKKAETATEAADAT